MGLTIKLNISLEKEWPLDRINWRKLFTITAVVLSSIGIAGVSGALLSLLIG